MKTFKQYLGEYRAMHSGSYIRGYEDQEAYVGAPEALGAKWHILGAQDSGYFA